MTRCDDLRPRLSLLADADLGPADEAELRAHLATCDACAGLLHDLQRVRDAGRSLGPMQPPDHIWLEVAGQVRLEAPAALAATSSRDRGALKQWISLAAAIVVVTLGAYAVSQFTAPPAEEPAATTTASAGVAPGVEAVVEQLSAALEKAITDLQTLAKDNARPEEAQVASALLNNLAVVDQAIAESRTALAQDPTSGPARDSLLEALRRKVGVLQATMVLINDMRLGDAEGAAQSAAGISKKSS
ncbi:MAG TPA: zf-HC2 domain-containing protein [Vicinamibacterales bacterium]|nr:zf-HC2 domain-containing protein [Vicinamibacterales bacterium]